MTTKAPWHVCLAAAALATPFVMLPDGPFAATSATPGANRGGSSLFAAPQPPPRLVRAKRRPPKPPAVVARPPQQPPRTPFTADDEVNAAIPGMPDARFWADSTADFANALPTQPGPWLVLSSGGSDGAFGAGLLNGLSASGQRQDYSVVTGVSTGALIAPFVFAGQHYDDALRDAFTKITSADIFEVGSTGESLLDTWPLKDTIAKEITPALLADIAAEYKRGRRLFVVTTDLDAERSVVWNMGAIAAHGGDAAMNLFRNVLLATCAIPGGFPPVLIDVESNGKHFAEMHVDGGVGGQFFVAPAALMASTSDYRLPATQLYIVLDTALDPEFAVVDPSMGAILTQTIGMAVTVDTRLMLDRSYIVAKRSGVGFNVASIPPTFNTPSKGPFDPDYMGALFQAGYDLGKGANPFSAEPPPYPGRPAMQSGGSVKTGAQ
jgi:predicted acylesterase/phospholipase RssA